MAVSLLCTWNIIKQLIGASSKYLYAYTAAGISVSKDKGVIG